MWARRAKRGEANQLQPIDPVLLGARRSARRSSRAASPATRSSWCRSSRPAIAHRGFALIDVISPCVTFNDHEGSTKSYLFTRQHDVQMTVTDFVPPARGDLGDDPERGRDRASRCTTARRSASATLPTATTRRIAWRCARAPDVGARPRRDRDRPPVHRRAVVRPARARQHHRAAADAGAVREALSRGRPRWRGSASAIFGLRPRAVVRGQDAGVCKRPIPKPWPVPS